MDSIREALTKAKATTAERPSQREHRDRPSVGTVSRAIPTPGPSWSAKPPPEFKTQPAAWTAPRVSLVQKHLDDHRIVSLTASDAAHVSFNVLRTRVRKELSDRGWHSIAVTSPTPGCGKTMVSLNLAFALARAPNCRVVLIDLDLRRSMVGQSLGVQAKGSIAGFLRGHDNPEDCFLQVAENLIVGVNDEAIKHSAELMHGPRMQALIATVSQSLAPDVLIFDLPPLLANDDALSFLPSAEGVLLVIGAGKSRVAEVADSERQISQMDKLLGVVLNKCEVRSEKNYYS